MLRSSLGSISTINNIIKHKPYVLLQENNHEKTVHIQQKLFQARYFFKRPNLENLLTKIKKIIKTMLEKVDKEKYSEETQGRPPISLTLWFFGIGLACMWTYLVAIVGAPEKDEDGNHVRDEFSKYFVPRAYLKRTLREIEYYHKLMKEPSREKLLPDPLPDPYNQPKYTLVIELTDVLVHSDWNYSTGWRFKKRPLLDYFLESLKDQYEIVIYTAEYGMTVFPLTGAIDPKNIIAFKLVRDATYYTGGDYVKRLNNLNRDLSKVICIDWNCNNVKNNKDNLFCIKRWSGNNDDTWLLDVVGFLKAIADNNIEDVRKVLRIYSKYDDPLMAYREKQEKFIDELEAQAEAKREEEKKKKTSWTSGFFKKT